MTGTGLDIAIVGMSVEVPGAQDLASFWSNLCEGTESIEDLTHEELLSAHVDLNNLKKKNFVSRTGKLLKIEEFAAEFFGYSPRDAATIDPQQRKLLECAWCVLEDAGIVPQKFEGKIGVWVSSSLNTYLLNNILSHPNAKQLEDIQQILFGNGQDYLATRIAYLLGLDGPAINVQTACSSSLVAVHEACQYLLSYQVDAAIAGGVSISVPQEKGYFYTPEGMLSPDGHCRAFSSDAQGTVFSNGLGLIVLKRLEDAIENNDAIYAVLKGSAVNNDGHRKIGYAAPSVDGQAEVINAALNFCELNADEIGYVEAHGTGTQLGDPIEISALQKAYEKTSHGKKQYCSIGSVKSNIGHLDAAAGIVGLIKVGLMLQHKSFVPTLHCDILNPKVTWHDSPFKVNVELHPWDIGEHQRRLAAVSSFGIGGTNAHVILSEFEGKEPNIAINAPALFVFSAKTETALKKNIAQIKSYMESHEDVLLHDVARTLQQGRSEFGYRTFVVANSIDELIKILKDESYKIVHCTALLDVLDLACIKNCNFQYLIGIGEQWVQGYQPNWKDFYTNIKPQMLHLPHYAFERKRYWIEPCYEEDDEDKRLPIQDWFYYPDWKKSMLSGDVNYNSSRTLLIFMPCHQSAQDWVNQLMKDHNVICVTMSDEYKKQDDGHYSLKPNDKSSYETLFSDLFENHVFPTHVLHMWSLTENESGCFGEFSVLQVRGLNSLVYIMQAWEKFYQDKGFNLTVVTNFLNLLGGDHVSQPAKATLLGAIKVIPKEYLNVQSQLIDIDHLNSRYLLKDIFREVYEDEEIAYRGQYRYVRSYTPIKLNQCSHDALDMDQHVVVITGGLGQLGLDIADYFSYFPKIKIALLARTPIPEATQWPALINKYDEDHPLGMLLRRVTEMRSRGANVIICSVDVSDFEKLQTTINFIEDNMGVVTEVVHAAGETVNGIISMKTMNSFEESYQAKVYGSHNLCEIFKHHKLNFFAMCSSMNSIIGGLGQIDNTAANAYIDYLSEQYAKETGQPVLGINWGAINVNRPIKVNVLHQFSDLSMEHKKNKMTDDEVNEVYTRLLKNQVSPRIVVSTMDFNGILKNWNKVSSLAELIKDRKAYDQSREHISNDVSQPQTEMQRFVADVWRQLLGLDQILLDDNFFDLGGHSLAAIQFISKVKDQYGFKVHVMNLYELPSCAEISDYLDKLLDKKNSTLALQQEEA